MQPDLDASNDETVAHPGEETVSDAETRIKLLLDKGPLAEAEEVCKQALGKFPDSDRLRSLQSDIQQKETAIRKLLDQGEGCLADRDFETAAEFFTGACHLLPLDGELADHIVGILHQHAQDVLEKDWQAADASLALAARIQPDGLSSPFLTDAVQERKYQAETKAGGLRNGMTRSATHPPTVSRTKAVLIAFATLSLFVVAALFPWKTFRARFVQPAASSTTGTLTIRTNIPDAEIFINEQQYGQRSGSAPLEIVLPPDTYKIRAIHPGYTDYGPVTAAVTKNGQTVLDVELDPKPAVLRVQGAETGTEVRVDGVLVGSVVPGPGLTGQLSPGLHAIELSRAGYLPRKVVLQLLPGKETLLSGSDVALHSTDASERLPDPPAAPRVDLADKKDSGAYADVLPALQAEELPQNADQATPAQAEQSEWTGLDKNSKAALEAFAAKYPASPHAEEAAGLIAALDREASALQLRRADEAAWKAVAPSEQSSLQAYLDRFAAGAHRGEAEQALAELRSAELLKADSAAIVALINQFASAWSRKDMNSILAMERDLDRQVLKVQLTPVKTIDMKISPLSPPQIAGTQATIVCRRQADETFLDGSSRQNPESVVTYLLSKRTGAWHIDGTR